MAFIPTRVVWFFFLVLVAQLGCARTAFSADASCWIQHRVTVHEWRCASQHLPPQGQEFALSVIVVLGGNNVLVLDSGATAAVGAAAFAAIAKRFPDKTIWILNSQPKPEHVLGNVGFKGVPESRMIAGQLTAQLMKSRCSNCIERFATRLGESAVAGTQALIPANILNGSKGQLRVSGGDFSAWHYSLEKSVETEEALVLHNTALKIHWVGSLVQNREVPDLSDGDLASRIAYLSRLLNRINHEQTLLGSFGALDPIWIQRNLNYFVQLQLDVLLRLDGGLSEVELIHSLGNGLSGVALQTHQLNIQRASRQSESFLFDTSPVVE